jgi:hypothetical protein
MMDGLRKDDEPTIKKLPIEADIPEYLVALALQRNATDEEQAVADLIQLAFFFLLRVGEYTMKGSRNETKQTVQFRRKDITFFKKNAQGKLQQLPRTASDEDIMAADGVTLKLTNQKNGWKNVCLHHHSNEHPVHNPTRAAARRYIYSRNNFVDDNTELSAYIEHSCRCDVTDVHIRKALKNAGAQLNYPQNNGIPIDRIDTHSLRAGGANALHLSGYSDREIQKMGRWRGDTFKEYISDNLHNFSEGMSKAMSKCFNFVNIAGGVFHDITNVAINTPYLANASTA